MCILSDHDGNSYIMNMEIKNSVMKDILQFVVLNSSEKLACLINRLAKISTTKRCHISVHILQLLSHAKLYPSHILRTQPKHKCITGGMPLQARKVSLPNETISRQITLKPEPTDPSDTIPLAVMGERGRKKSTNKMNSSTNMIGTTRVFLHF